MPNHSTEKDNLDSTNMDNEKVKEIIEIIQRGSEEILVEGDLKKKIILSLKEGKPLNVKLGLDPTSPDLHLGHFVILNQLANFQKLGHQILFIIGDFTARIGDPTGKSATRKPLSEDDVAKNSTTYLDQVFRVLDPDKTTVVYNATWLNELSPTLILNYVDFHHHPNGLEYH